MPSPEQTERLRVQSPRNSQDGGSVIKQCAVRIFVYDLSDERLNEQDRSVRGGKTFLDKERRGT